MALLHFPNVITPDSDSFHGGCDVFSVLQPFTMQAHREKSVFVLCASCEVIILIIILAPLCQIGFKAQCCSWWLGGLKETGSRVFQTEDELRGIIKGQCKINTFFLPVHHVKLL